MIAHWQKQEADPSILQLIALAKNEDLGPSDITTSLIADADSQVRFELIVKRPCVLAGQQVARLILDAYDEGLVLDWNIGMSDGARIERAPIRAAQLQGRLGAILSAERVLLNFLQRLSGVATLTRKFVDAVAGFEVAICDTRKTTPGWRALEKYAVACGGGVNHRRGLFDAVLIKDNHLAGVPTGRLAGVVFEMLNQASRLRPAPKFVEVEAAGVAQARELCKIVGIDMILLDNFSNDELREAVSYRDHAGLRGKVQLEASGGISLETVCDVAQTGVERISVGAITHSATAVDMSLERVS